MSESTWREILSDWIEYGYLMPDVDFTAFFQDIEDMTSLAELDMHIFFVCMVYFLNDVNAHGYGMNDEVRSDLERAILFKCDEGEARGLLDMVEFAYRSHSPATDDNWDLFSQQAIDIVISHAQAKSD